MRKIIAEKVDFTIKVDLKNNDYDVYQRKAYRAAYEMLGYDTYNGNFLSTESPIQTIINKKVNNAFGDDSIVIVTSYNERQGSFIVTFSIFVFAAFMNYGSFRESLDYLRDDLNYFFRETLDTSESVSVNYSTKHNQRLLNLHRSLVSNSLSPLYRQLKVLIAIIGFIGLVAVCFATYAVYKVERMSQPQIPNEIIEQAVTKEINRQTTQRTNEELFRLLQELKGDSSKVK